MRPTDGAITELIPEAWHVQVHAGFMVLAGLEELQRITRQLARPWPFCWRRRALAQRRERVLDIIAWAQARAMPAEPEQLLLDAHRKKRS